MSEKYNDPKNLIRIFCGIELKLSHIKSYSFLKNTVFTLKKSLSLKFKTAITKYAKCYS